MNGHYFFFGILMIFLISMPIFLILEWNKNRKKSLNEIFKIYWVKYRFIILLIIALTITEYFIPFNKNHGIEFNSERVNIGIPILKDDWKKNKSESDKYSILWCKPESHVGHYKKVIEYGVFDIKIETDYYNEKEKGIIASSKYNYETGEFEYYIIKPDLNKISECKLNEHTLEKTALTKKINKQEFEKYISE